MSRVFVVQEKNINVVVELYKKIANKITAINTIPVNKTAFLDLKI